MGKNKPIEILQDGHLFIDGDEKIIFNHYSFCEIIKHIMVKYGSINIKVAQEKISQSYLYKLPSNPLSVALLSHELLYHWAMLLIHGEMYWLKGIASDYNNFEEEYMQWEQHTITKYQLKEPFEFID